MLSNRSDFLQRLLHQSREDKPYWDTSPPTPEILQQAASAVKDEIGFEAHCHYFNLITEVIDACVKEHVDAALGKGAAFPNTWKHPRVLALVNLDIEERAGSVCAAAQGVKWIDEIQPWIHGHTLQNEIAKRVLIGILMCSAKVKKCFSAVDLKALIRLGNSIRGQDSFGPVAQVAIIVILASNADDLPLDSETQTLLPEYLDYIAPQTDLKYVLKAIDKLRSKLKAK